MDTTSMDAEELKVFLQEAEEQLQVLDEDIIRLEKEADNTELVQAIFRAAHTLKGSSGMLGFQKMAEMTHAMEDALDRLRSGTLTVSAELVDELLQSVDALKILKENVTAGDEGDLDIAPLVASLRASADSDEPRVSHPELEVTPQKAEPLQTMRIDVERMDVLMNTVRELVIDSARVGETSRVLQSRYRDDDSVRALGDTSSHIARVVDELNEEMMRVRMLSVGILFGRFPRLVRDLARAAGKSTDFIMEGEDTEIDRSVIEKIGDPLVHMLRNAVDHGVESPEAREAAGKPLSAAVKLSARHEQGHILITLQDDGRGIDPQAIKESAIKKGVVTAEAAERLSEAEAIDLIFEPGVSTAHETTQISGRGVGMDVVRRSITAVNGLIEVKTRAGVGTTVVLQLPLTLATFRGLIVESGTALYAIPLSYVQETARLEAGCIDKIIDREVVNLRGDIIPLLRLSSIRQPRSPNGHRNGNAFMVVVGVGSRNMALAVDVLRGQQDIVVKSLGRYIGQTDGITGASILADGQIVLIVDVASLARARPSRAYSRSASPGLRAPSRRRER